jgi:nitrogen fixation NifU-like protein
MHGSTYDIFINTLKLQALHPVRKMAYDMYQERVLEHYRKPRNLGHLPHADLTGTESNPLCGDKISVELQLDPSGSRVEDIRFSGEGCAISVASASLLTIEAKGKPLTELKIIKQAEMERLVGVPLSPVRIKCVMTSLVALNRALDSADSAKKGTGQK